MAQTYVPIYRAKPGEFEALSNVSKDHVKRVLPLFEIPRITPKVSEQARFKECAALTCAYLAHVAQGIANVRKGYDAMADISQWDPEALVETGEHVLPYLYSQLRKMGVKVVPVVGFDSWESPLYRVAMQGVEMPDDGYFCIRLDSQAIEDAADPFFLEERIQEILDGLGIEPGRCGIIIDFGDVTARSLVELIDQTDGVLQVLAPMGFKFFATIGCSLPPTIDKAVKDHDSTGKVVRKEMLLWQSMLTQYPAIPMRYGDYGVRGPSSVDDVVAPDANGKIRHTIDQNFYVLRGHSMRQGDKGAQMYKLAATLVSSPYFMGAGFSWGDAEIALRSKKLTDPSIKVGPGGHSKWIAFDTSHHLAYVVAEVDDFQYKTAVSGIAVTQDQ
jgi:hypothetical protein